jgi:hypothetical protein
MNVSFRERDYRPAQAARSNEDRKILGMRCGNSFVEDLELGARAGSVLRMDRRGPDPLPAVAMLATALAYVNVRSVVIVRPRR